MLAGDSRTGKGNWQAGNPEERENWYKANGQVDKLAKNCRAD